MSFLSGLVSSAARGLAGGADAVAQLGKVGVEKQMKIDLAKETADIEFQKNKQLEEFRANLADQAEVNRIKRERELLLDPEVRDFSIETEKKKSAILDPLQQSQKNKADLELAILERRDTALQTLINETQKPDGNPEIINKSIDQLTILNQLEGSDSRTSRGTALMSSGNAMLNLIKNDPIFAKSDAGALMRQNAEKLIQQGTDLLTKSGIVKRNMKTPPPSGGGTGTENTTNSTVPVGLDEANKLVGKVDKMQDGTFQKIIGVKEVEKDGKKVIMFEREQVADMKGTPLNQTPVEGNTNKPNEKKTNKKVSGRTNRQLKKAAETAEDMRNYSEKVKESRRSRYNSNKTKDD